MQDSAAEPARTRVSRSHSSLMVLARPCRATDAGIENHVSLRACCAPPVRRRGLGHTRQNKSDWTGRLEASRSWSRIVVIGFAAALAAIECVGVLGNWPHPSAVGVGKTRALSGGLVFALFGGLFVLAGLIPRRGPMRWVTFAVFHVLLAVLATVLLFSWSGPMRVGAAAERRCGARSVRQPARASIPHIRE